MNEELGITVQNVGDLVAASTSSESSLAVFVIREWDGPPTNTAPDSTKPSAGSRPRSSRSSRPGVQATFAAIKELERLVTQYPNGVVLRYGALYGPRSGSTRLGGSTTTSR